MQEKYEPLLDVLTIDKFKEQFNALETLKDENDSFLTWLVKQDYGLTVLSKETHILNPDNLNTPIKKGFNTGKTVLWYLAGYPEGREILVAHPELLLEADLNAMSHYSNEQLVSRKRKSAFADNSNESKKEEKAISPLAKRLKNIVSKCHYAVKPSIPNAKHLNFALSTPVKKKNVSRITRH